MPQAYSVSSHLEERLKGRRMALEALRRLPEDYLLFYNPSVRGKEAEPAIDYILAHRQKGLLAVVVKSGEIVEEPGGFISQFHAQRQLYRILDPMKPAEAALGPLLAEFDRGMYGLLPCGITVLFPDTRRIEFSQPKKSYLFADDIEAPDFIERLDQQFQFPSDSGVQAQFVLGFGRLGEFLKNHSDNAAIIDEAKQKPPVLKEVKKATPPVAAPPPVAPPPAPVEMRAPVQAPAPAQKRATPPQVSKPVFQPPPRPKAIPKPRFEEPAPVIDDFALERVSAPPKARKVPPPPVAKAPPAAVVAAAVSPAPAAQQPPRMRGVAREAAAPERIKQRDLFAWVQEVQEKGESDAMLSPAQWALIVGISVAVICLAYFLSRNLAMATG